MPHRNGLPTHEELRTLSESEIATRIDVVLDGPASDWRFMYAQMFRDELVRREQDRATVRMLAWTRQVRNLTGVILLLTVVNIVLVLLR